MRFVCLLLLIAAPLAAHKRAITFEDYIALKSVSDPQLSPDGKWVAYTVSIPSLQDNRNVSRVSVAEVATGKSRPLTGGPGSDRQPRWSPDGKTLAFVSTRDSGAQVWVLPIAGGDARKVSHVPDGVSDPLWLPDGSGLLVVSDIKWPANQEIDQRNGQYPTDARIWTGLMWRHWDDFRAGKRQHLFRVDLATGKATDLTPDDHDVPAIATSGDGDVAISPDGQVIAVAMHGDSTVADNTNVDIYLIGPEGATLRPLSTRDERGAHKKTMTHPHPTITTPAEVWVSGKALTHHTDSAFATLDLPPLKEFGFLGAVGVSVFGWSQKPPGFDPTKKYPLIYLIHGGPQGAWTDSWGPRWNNQMFAARGFVVAEVNFHGSTGYGQKFTDAISQHWGDYPYEDVMKGLDVVARLPYVDSTRMGAAGASYGGYMVYWLAGHTDRFKVLVDHDGVFNTASMAGSTEELWFTDWEFGGTVYANRALYEKWSPLNFVGNWKTPMLIVHSQLDYRVDLSEGYQAFTAAKRIGVDAKFLYFPDEGHWVLRPRNRRIWWGTVLDWLEVHLHESAHP